MDRWVEHYLELYSRETKITNTALISMETMPTLDHLDTLKSIAKVNCALYDLASGKAPGKDGVPIEVIRSEKIYSPQRSTSQQHYAGMKDRSHRTLGIHI
jgi:hypothetical protein